MAENPLALGNDVLNCIRDHIDGLIKKPYSKTCRLVSPGSWTDCPNCLYDPIGKKSQNVWVSGGPRPFASGTTCPMCSGKGKRMQEQSVEIEMLCIFKFKDFVFPMQGLDVRAPYSVIQTRGFMHDLPKVRKCDHMICQVSIEGIARRKYKLMGEPNDDCNIVQDRYFVCAWERIGT